MFPAPSDGVKVSALVELALCCSAAESHSVSSLLGSASEQKLLH